MSTLPCLSCTIAGHSYTRGQLKWTPFFFFSACEERRVIMNPPWETQTLMAHRLIAVLFSSLRYATSLHVKHTPGSAAPPKVTIPHLERFHLSLSECFFSAPSPPSLPQLLMHHLFFHPSTSIALLLIWIPPPPPHSSFRFHGWFCLSCRWAPGQQWPGWETTEVTLGLGGWQPCCHWHRATLMRIQLWRSDRGRKN